VPGGRHTRHGAVAQALDLLCLRLTAVPAVAGRRLTPSVGCGLAAMPNDTASQPIETVSEPSWLASWAWGPAQCRESHAGAGEHKALMGSSNIRFFLSMRTIFSICRMLIALVHFFYEAAARYISHHMGHGLHAFNALSHHRAGGHGPSPTVVFYTSRRK
jgi:hypothetical protein